MTACIRMYTLYIVRSPHIPLALIDAFSRHVRIVTGTMSVYHQRNKLNIAI